MRYSIEQVGTVAGRPVAAITLSSPGGLAVTVLTYGCIVQSVVYPDRNGVAAPVTLGYGKFDDYIAKGHPFFGAVAGRFANRIHNGRFALNGKSYSLECNEGPTGQHLHGGARGFDKAVWGYEVEETADAVWLHLHHVSPDGDAGYPGRVDVTHSIGVDDADRLWFDFRAVADQDTPLNLVNHSYYNLSGVEGATVEDHELTLAADFVLPVDDKMIPTGTIDPVAGTAFDFRSARLIGDAMAARPAKDFDHCFAIRPDAAGVGALALAADLYHPASGRGMRVSTTQPGVQVYNGFKFPNREWYGREGKRYPAFAGLCLETEGFPDAPNQPQFPSAILPAGRLWQARTAHAFYRR